MICTDPWLKRAKKWKEKPAKEKKMPKTKKTERRKKEKSKNDEFDNIDKECDQALEEARKKAVAASLGEFLVIQLYLC